MCWDINKVRLPPYFCIISEAWNSPAQPPLHCRVHDRTARCACNQAGIQVWVGKIRESNHLSEKKHVQIVMRILSYQQ